eukprot:TRINITY_DN43030_c0_g1_i1.p1 TRINITY_DN43030_c0_g1~~TRINITY_DN43030_c0_g1_i1.p1  ORF type:complete len:203 (+),score=20.08 TRINITY_DN43030_c0_g1_i1:39-611(+)
MVQKQTYPAGELEVITGRNCEEGLPCSVLWAPIPMFTHLFPIIGHTMLTDSKGTVYDFAGYLPGSGRSGVCRNVGIFGRAVRMLQFKAPLKSSTEEFEDDWDEAVAVANAKFSEQVHMGVVNNCHSHVTTVLNNVRHSHWPRWIRWNSIVMVIALTLFGRFVPGRGSCFKVWYYLWPCIIFIYVIFKYLL